MRLRRVDAAYGWWPALVGVGRGAIGLQARHPALVVEHPTHRTERTAMPVTPIESYQVIYSANQFARRIGLLAGSTYIGQLVFHPDGATLPPDGLLGDQPQLHYHLADFENAIDLLRNEQPMSLLYNGSGGGFENALISGTEPVGEGESRAVRLIRT
jgi:hypothetical protein